VFEKLERLNFEVLEIKTVLSSLRSGDNGPRPDFTLIEEKFPILNENQLAEFENWISVDTNKQLAVSIE